MHDRNGTSLKVGDVVLIPARIVSVQAQDEYCNVCVQSLHGRKPDADKESFWTNTGVVILHERASA